MAENVNINPDGSTSFESGAGEESTMPPAEGPGTEGIFEEAPVVAGTDPAIYLLLVAIALGILFFIYKRNSREEDDDFFSNLDGEKVSSNSRKSAQRRKEVQAHSSVGPLLSST